MKITNELNLPPAFLRAVQAHEHDIGASDISVSELIGPPRIRMLRKRYPDQITSDVSDMIWLLMGTAVHEHLAAHAANHITEERFSMPVQTALGPYIVSGQLDTLSLDSDATLSDYKTTSVYKVKLGDVDDWTKQLNLYAHLAEHAGHEVSALQVIAILRDWRTGESKREKGYPQSQVVVIPIERWSDRWTQSYLEDRVLVHQQAEKELPLCTPEEMWTNKRGDRVRCTSYCDALAPCRLMGDAQWGG